MSSRATPWGISLASLGLLAAVGCSGKVTDSGEARAVPGSPAGGSGSSLPPVTSSGSSAGIGGRQSDDPNGQGGTAPTINGEPGCPTIVFFSGATIQADWPFSLQVAQSGLFHACRNDECYDGQLGTGASNNVTIRPMKASSPDEEMSLSIDGWLSLSWREPADRGTFKNGDRYVVTFDAQTNRPAFTVIDTTVNYVPTDHGMCGGTTRSATIDLRGSAGQTAYAGAPGEAGAPGALGQGGAPSDL